MSLIRPAILVILVLLLSSCARQPEFNRYQLPAGQSQAGDSAVAELQRNARAALERQDYQQAVESLQRAIKIEPRNPYSWYYLAEAYWLSGDFRRCVEMVDRAFSYSDADDGLDEKSRRLRRKCQPE